MTAGLRPNPGGIGMGATRGNTFPLLRILSVVFVAFIALNILYQFLLSFPQESLRDFGSFYESGKAALEGRNPYEIHDNSYRVTLKYFDGANPNLNPPASLLVFAPISLLDPTTAFRTIWWGSLVAFLATLLALTRTYQPPHGGWLVLWAVSLPGFWGTLFLGQIYAMLLVACAAAWILQDRNRPVAAGLLIGLVVALKPNFLVWPVLLLLAGHRRIALPALASFAVLSAAPVPLFGAGVYSQWLAMWFADDPARLEWVTNMSMIAYASRIGVPWLGKLAALITLGGLAVWAWRRRPGTGETGLLALFASLLASPVAWIHYSLFLLPPLFSVEWTRTMVVGAVLLTVPRLIADSLYMGPVWLEITLGSLYTWGLLTLAVPVFRKVIMRGAPLLATIASRSAYRDRAPTGQTATE